MLHKRKNVCERKVIFVCVAALCTDQKQHVLCTVLHFNMKAIYLRSAANKSGILLLLF